jgi:hypothetical protein
MKLLRAVLIVVMAAVAVVIGLVLAGVGNGTALLIYVLVVAALLFSWVVTRLNRALPPAEDFRSAARKERSGTSLEQFDTVKRLVTLAGSSQGDLFRLRPLVRDVVTARLSRGYGVDLEREPQKAALLLGHGRAWELVRPDSPGPSDRYAPGWSQPEMEQLVEELENL